MKTEVIADFEGVVICDLCGTDYSNSNKQGGFVFTDKGVCPDCAPEHLESIEKYNERKYIKAFCPLGMSFKDFIIQYRNGNNLAIMYTPEDGESLSDIIRKD